MILLTNPSPGPGGGDELARWHRGYAMKDDYAGYTALDAQAGVERLCS